MSLGERLTHRPTELSGGEQQRVSLARALVNQPSVLLADEPTGNLDSETAADVIQVIDDIVSERRITVILVTHDEELAKRFADRVLRIQDGNLRDQGA